MNVIGNEAGAVTKPKFLKGESFALGHSLKNLKVKPLFLNQSYSDKKRDNSGKRIEALSASSKIINQKRIEIEQVDKTPSPVKGSSVYHIESEKSLKFMGMVEQIEGITGSTRTDLQTDKIL